MWPITFLFNLNYPPKRVTVLPPPVLSCASSERVEHAWIPMFWCKQQNAVVAGVAGISLPPVSMAWAPLAQRCANPFARVRGGKHQRTTGSWPGGFKRDESIIWLNFACSVSFLTVVCLHSVSLYLLPLPPNLTHHRCHRKEEIFNVLQHF